MPPPFIGMALRMSFLPNETVPPERRDPALQTGMFSVLAALLTHAQGTVARQGDGPRTGPAVDGRELMRALSRLQRGETGVFGVEAEAELAPVLREAGNLQNVLRRLRSTRVGASLASFD